MKPYIGLVHKEGGSAYGITFPDAPGCFSAADDLDEVFRKAEEALTLWMSGSLADGGPIPETRDLSVIKADSRWSRDFLDAALVIAVTIDPGRLRDAA